MKRILASILTLVMILSCVSALSEEVPPVYDYDELVVSTVTKMNGNFFSPIFGNNTADLDVQILIHGYNMVEWDKSLGGFVTDDSVVSGLSVTENELGDRTYTVALYQDLCYSDGTPITANDYAFAILLSASPEMAKIGASVNGSDAIEGMVEYMNGEADTIKGVRVINDYMLSVTVKHEYRPFFYELGLLYYNPYPISVIAPGCTVKDDGNGVYVDGGMTAEMLQTTMLDENNGYVSHPSVVSGAYTLISFDGYTAEFAINPYYKGNSEGKLPMIAKLVYTQVFNDQAMSELASGKVGLVNKCVSADEITEGLQNISGGAYAMSSYPRTGLSYISFCCEKNTVGSNAVRQALAMCLDKDSVVAAYVGNYGLRVDGYYGMGQWMYQMVDGGIQPPVDAPEEGASADDEQAYEDALAAWDALSLENIKIYNFDTEAAEQLLIDDGWTLNRDGAEFVKGTDDVRCKMVDGELVALDLRMAYPEENTMGDVLQQYFVDNLPQIGVKVTLIPTNMTDLLQIHYRQVDRDVDMIFLATNFTVIFDPSQTYSPEDYATSVYNTSAINDPELYERAVDMRMTEPDDLLGYCTKWVAFQERWTEVLPAIPIYSNAYFDFYTANLHEYVINENVTWTQAIIGAYMSDIEELVEEEETEEDIFEEDDSGDDEFEIFD